jgi:hypothetical protein
MEHTIIKAVSTADTADTANSFVAALVSAPGIRADHSRFAAS